MQQARFTRDVAGIHCTFRLDTNHYYQRLVNSKLSFHVYRPRKLKTFEAVAWSSPVVRKPRTDARFIANALLFSVVRNARLVSCNGQLSFWHWNIKGDPSSYIFHKFNPSLTKVTSHGFVGLLPCFNVFAFQIFKRLFNRNFREFLIVLHLMLMWSSKSS